MVRPVLAGTPSSLLPRDQCYQFGVGTPWLTSCLGCYSTPRASPDRVATLTPNIPTASQPAANAKA